MNTNMALGKTISVGGLTTNYHESGDGQTAVLLHGSAHGVSAYANWHQTIPYLSERLHILAPDIPGFGYTERTGFTYGMPSWVEHILQFLDALKIDKASFVGNSFGGGLSLAIACMAPDRVEKLVLMGSGGLSFKPTPGLIRAWSYTPTKRNMQDLLETFVFDKSLVTDELIEQRYQASLLPGAGDVFKYLAPPHFRDPGYKTGGIPEQQLRAISHDTLILHGREDPIIPPALSVKLNQLIDRSELHIFGQCGHWVQAEHKNRFNRLVRDFLTDEIT